MMMNSSFTSQQTSAPFKSKGPVYILIFSSCDQENTGKYAWS